ncbi:MAG TPA: response regulator [Vicinamibacterales bacterium]|nr:response regulator [Vicinamibacterales bacterium]
MHSTLSLLLVDDDELDRLAIVRSLRQGGVPVSISERTDCASAIQALKTQAFDCVLLDYHLPGSNGLETLHTLRAAGVHVPVITLTGQGDEELAVELMKAGASDYLNKNAVTPERLQRSIRYALAIHHAEEERALLLVREQKAREQAQAANRAKDEFLATLSHELRTPLNAILGWSKLLASGHLDEETTRRAIQIIDRNTRLQAQLIEDLLDISRIVTGKLRLDFRTVQVASIVEAALDSVRPAADLKRIAIECDLDRAHTSLMCDPSRMQQVVWNLVTNAIKFTADGGSVRVSTRREDDRLVLVVADSGAGIAPDFLPYVFDRFRQQDGAPTRRHGGLGLGLAIVRHLVEQHGGTVQAESDGEGHGARFIVSVPTAPMPQALSDAIGLGPDTLDGMPNLTGVVVMVVDDDADARALVTTVLESYGARVLPVASGAEALDALEVEHPDVLLSDLAMPSQDGYALIRQIRAFGDHRRVLPAAALTAFATATDRARALLAGYQAHIPKPVEPSELAAVVAALAGRTMARS